MDERAQGLNTLGLTSLQARIYIMLLESGKTTTQILSESLEVDRSDVYKALIKLRKLGLVEENIAKPKSFAAIPMQYGVSALLEKKKAEFSKIEQNAKEFLEKFGTFEKRILAQDDTFLLFTRTDESPDRIKDQWNNAIETVDNLSEEETFFDSVESKFEYFCEALKKGVRIRMLISKGVGNYEPSKQSKKKFNILLSNSNFKIRYSPETDLPKFTCFDRRESWIAVGKGMGLRRLPILLSNNDFIAKILTALFERLWNEAPST